MYLGLINSTSAFVDEVDSSICFLVSYDMNVMYCISKGFSLYNFGNKFVFIAIVIMYNVSISDRQHVRIRYR